MEVVASLSQGRTAAAQCGLFAHKSVPVIFEQPRIPKYCINTKFISYKMSYVFRLTYSHHQADYRAKNGIFIVAFSFCIQSNDGCILAATCS